MLEWALTRNRAKSHANQLPHEKAFFAPIVDLTVALNAFL